jgi:TPR repeat protein
MSRLYRFLFAAILGLISALPAEASPAKTACQFPFMGSDAETRANTSVCKRAAEGGDAEAQFILSRMHLMGLNVAKDEKLAERWLRSAAEQGNIEAQIQMGNNAFLVQMNDGRLGKEINYTEVVRWYEAAASRGSNEAKTYLIDLYLDDQIPLYNVPKALQLINTTTIENAETLLRIGLLFERGVPSAVAVSKEKAATYYTKAAMAGSGTAASLLGIAHYTGQGAEKNMIEAYGWLAAAAAIDAAPWDASVKGIAGKLADAALAQIPENNKPLARSLATARQQALQQGQSSDLRSVFGVP